MLLQYLCILFSINVSLCTNVLHHKCCLFDELRLTGRGTISGSFSLNVAALTCICDSSVKLCSVMVRPYSDLHH